MEFQPANKSYRLASLQGFRSFIKVKQGRKMVYWEPFQDHLLGTAFRKKQSLNLSAHDLTLIETNLDLGLEISVNYFTLPEENYASLVRRVRITNLKNKVRDIELIDGLPVLNPYGLKDWASKNMSRTVEAWVEVGNIEKKAPYYHLKMEVSDTPQVTHIKEGNFFVSFQVNGKMTRLLDPIVEAAERFWCKDMILPRPRVSCAMISVSPPCNKQATGCLRRSAIPDFLSRLKGIKRLFHCSATFRMFSA